MPVKDLHGRGIAQRAIGDQAHVRVVRFDGKVESQVVSYVGWVPTVLQSSPSFVFEAQTLSGLMYMCKSRISLKRNIAQGAVCDEADMRLVCFDGRLEGQVVAYIRRVSTVLQFAIQ